MHSRIQTGGHAASTGIQRMRTDGQPPPAIASFLHFHRLLATGATGLLTAAEALPVERLTDYEELDGYELSGHEYVDQALILKFNGGLGTSMGLDLPRCLLPVRDGLTFLDYIARQVGYLQQQLDRHVPLMFMNSFHTREATLEALAAYPELRNGIAPDFVQHRFPKINPATLEAATWPANPDREWCPPGHGDVFASLDTTGLLDELLAAGYRYVFLSNADNLGATLDIKILGYMVENRVPLLMEVANRTPSDRKGGHLAQNPAGGLLLREFAQCPEAELDGFQDIRRYQFFNTNNLWAHLPSIKETLRSHCGFLPLPPIFNRKPVDPMDISTPEVIQMESAAGSSISVVPGAAALRVPRIRFLPVKRCEDLLIVQSDVYRTARSHRLVMNPKRINPQPRRSPTVRLDPRYYGHYRDLEARFPFGPPSLVRCLSLEVEGDVRFGRDVVIEGNVRIRNPKSSPLLIPDGTVLTETNG